MVQICLCLGNFSLSKFLYNFVFPGRVHFSMFLHRLNFHLSPESATSWQGLGACVLRNSARSNSTFPTELIKKVLGQ